VGATAAAVAAPHKRSEAIIGKKGLAMKSQATKKKSGGSVAGRAVCRVTKVNPRLKIFRHIVRSGVCVDRKARRASKSTSYRDARKLAVSSAVGCGLVRRGHFVSARVEHFKREKIVGPSQACEAEPV